jgi:hypothetical protein
MKVYFTNKKWGFYQFKGIVHSNDNPDSYIDSLDSKDICEINHEMNQQEHYANGFLIAECPDMIKALLQNLVFHQRKSIGNPEYAFQSLQLRNFNKKIISRAIRIDEIIIQNWVEDLAREDKIIITDIQFT